MDNEIRPSEISDTEIADEKHWYFRRKTHSNTLGTNTLNTNVAL